MQRDDGLGQAMAMAAARDAHEKPFAELKERIDRLERAVELLCDGLMDDAQRVLRGG